MFAGYIYDSRLSSLPASKRAPWLVQEVGGGGGSLVFSGVVFPSLAALYLIFWLAIGLRLEA